MCVNFVPFPGGVSAARILLGKRFFACNFSIFLSLSPFLYYDRKGNVLNHYSLEIMQWNVKLEPYRGGIRCPIIREGDDLARIVVESVTAAAKAEGFSLRDRDVVSITESVVARAQGNYASTADIASDVKGKAWRRHDRRSFPDPFPQPLCHLPARHRAGRAEGGADAQLPER